MSRIVIDAREYPTSTGRYVRKLLEYLERIDANSKRQYLVLIKSVDFDSYQPKAKNFSKVKSDFKEFTFSEQIGLLRQVRSLTPDLIHFAKDHQPVLYSGKTVTTMHDLTTARFYNPTKNWLVFKLKQLVYIWVVRRVAQKSTRIITISNFVKDDLVRFTKVDDKKISVTYEAADKISASALPFPRLKGGKFLLYVGRAQPHKNLKRLIDAFGVLQTRYPDLHLVLVGKKDALSKKHEIYAKQQDINNVIFTGYIEEGELRWLYENCITYVFPSLSEGFGLPALEAMIHGAPVTSSNATCLPEINGDGAYYFDPKNTTDIAAKIEDVITDDVLRRRLIELGSKQVAKYSWQRMAEQTLNIYKKLLG